MMIDNLLCNLNDIVIQKVIRNLSLLYKTMTKVFAITCGYDFQLYR